MRKKKNYTPAVYAVLCICCLCTLVPCALIVITSLRTTAEIVQSGLFGNIQKLHWENYIQAWKVGHFPKYLFNSMYISLFSVIGVLLFSLLSSYAMSCLKFKGRNLFQTLIVMGLVIPLEIIVIPLFYDMKSMGLMEYALGSDSAHDSHECAFWNLSAKRIRKRNPGITPGIGTHGWY